MKPTFILDTCVYTQPLKREPNVEVIRQWQDLEPHTLCISSITHGECVKGLAFENNPWRWERYEGLLAGMLDVLPFDQRAAERYGTLWAEQARSGISRPDLDLMIAAVALVHDLVLVTENTSDFEGIPGLVIDDWSK